MKRRIVFAVAIALVTVTFSVFAQQRNQAENRQRLDEQKNRYENQGGRPGQGGRGGQGGGGGGLFRLLDIDRDGNLSAKEIDGAVAVLMKLDANKDGILDAKELAVRGGGGKGKGNEGTQDGRGSRQRDEGPPRRGPGQKNDGQTNRPAGNRGESK
ncbi:MAG: hypothetical protein HOB29_08670 [Planctomycetaceae bacterium]|jgi:hypothetical protein|nr:hypothetical protein [Planctomycetaceae bacterium]MBT5885728.1 hypothetical protein [Planctomycetaceae bacterium]